MEESGSRLDLSLAGDNDHDVILCILTAADGELLHAQLKLVASLDGSAALAIDLDVTVVDSGTGVDRCSNGHHEHHLLGDLLSLITLLQILGLKAVVPDVLIVVILAQCSLDVSLQSSLSLELAVSGLSSIDCLFCQIVIDSLDGSLGG